MLGQRLAEARELAEMTQEGLARAVHLERTAIGLLERGERNLRVTELINIARVLGRPLSFFTEPPIPAVVSRRRAPHTAHESTQQMDAELQQFAFDVRALAQLGLLDAVERSIGAHVPRTVVEAESAAARFRRQLDDPTGPMADLGAACEAFGLFTFAAELGKNGPDGGCVEVEVSNGSLGVAVINGDADPGRRRMTLAHELGHWLFGDAYDVETSSDNESMINAFAIHFLAPRSGVVAVWKSHDEDDYGRALAVAATFRLSWSAAVAHLRNVDLITHQQHDALARQEPRRGDFLARNLVWQQELTAPSLSPGFLAACMRGVATGALTSARALELTRGVIAVDDLPETEPASLHDIRRAFEGHA